MRFVPGIAAFHRYRGLSSLRSLRQAIRAEQPDLIVPCNDGVVDQLHALHTQYPELRPLIERSLGQPEAYPVAASRARLLALAVELGIRVPLTQSVASEAELSAWNGQSAVLKTDGSAGGEGVAIVHGQEQMADAYRRLSKPISAAMALKRFIVNRNPLVLWSWWKGRGRSGPQVVVQAFIEGRPANTMIACWQGKVLAAVTVEVLCSQGATGAATVVRVIWNDEIENASRRLAERLELNGFYGLDFMLEADHGDAAAAYLIEMNPRCTQLGHLQIADRGDLVAALLKASNERQEAQNQAQPDHAIHGNPITGDTIAFFPQACLWNPHSPYLKGYHDVPWEAPALLRELLLEEWPYRQWPARLYHRFSPPNRKLEMQFEPEATPQQHQIPIASPR
jgi:predicted ATP-grasp superfamily ATP-dependent carboligase